MEQLKIKLYEFFEDIQRVKAYGSENFKLNSTQNNSKKRQLSEITPSSSAIEKDNLNDMDKPSPKRSLPIALKKET